jgi:hypothetical protein
LLRSSEIQEMSLHNKDQLCHPFMAKLYKSVWGCLKPVWRCCGHIGGLKLHVCYCPTPPPWGPSSLYGSWISCVLCIRCKKMYLYLLPNIPMVHFWRDFKIKIFCWELFPFNAGKLTPFIQSSMNIAYIPHNLSKKNQLVTFLFAMKLSVVWFGSMVLKRHFQPYFSYIVAISFIDGGNRSTRWKPPTCRKSLTNFILILTRFKYLQIMQRKLYSKFFFLTTLQASTLTFVWLSGTSENWHQTSRSCITVVRLSGTSENWHQTSRSCITVVRRDKWKNQIPKRAGTTDKSISTGINYWVFCIKDPCLISNLSIIYFD